MQCCTYTLVTESQGAAATEKHRWSITRCVHFIQDLSRKLIRKTTFQSNSYQGERRKQFICLLLSHLLLPTSVFHSTESTLPCACRVHHPAPRWSCPGVAFHPNLGAGGWLEHPPQEKKKVAVKGILEARGVYVQHSVKGFYAREWHDLATLWRTA